MQVYIHPKCTTCKKALTFLDAQSCAYETIDITKQAPPREVLERSSATSIRKMFNTSGMQYREQGLKDKLEALSKDEALDLLTQNGMLVKRPVLVTEASVLQGFKQSEWESALACAQV